ncbi:long-chain-fatty-acid--CoA ligase [Actinokineospora globicatena]|uniref:Acyl-CoA synthetase n=1 Tax=Actinokineospora globicatena TaxID=103729 RepID=A0A9W6QGC9_9PSEU|nr:long-chain-fatty-acid--CoA ligase [Actinokineospora globicatena]GLW89933.1 acyl-CoA synthetase [Actinokineospora globicatena]
MQRPDLITEITGYQAATRPDQVAITCAGTDVTYRDLHLGSNRTANALRAANLAPGARVAYLGKESVHYYDIAFGTAKSEAVLVPVNWRLTPAEVEHILRDAQVELVFAERELVDTVERLRAGLPKLATIVELDTATERGAGFELWRGGQSTVCALPDITPDTPFAQVYTSGTTGLPKGVVLPHRSFFTLRDVLETHAVDWFDLRPDDVSLIGLPGLNTAGLSWSMQGFTAGVTNVAMRMFVSQEAVDLVHRLGVTTTFVAPTMLAMMFAEPNASRAAFGSLRRVVYGGSPISETLLLQCLDMIPGELLQAYSSTEAGNVVTVLPAVDHVVGSRLLASAGKPSPDVEVRVVDADGNPLPDGEQGQVCVRSPALMLGYFNQPEATAKVLRDGWLRMGDVGYLDRGYLYLLDRVDDTIIVAGQNVYPVEVENVLAAHPAVADVAVVGVPHPRWGESVQAFVVVRPGERVTARDLLLFVRGSLADFKVPTGYEFVDSLPRNPMGKVLRRSLRTALTPERS